MINLSLAGQINKFQVSRVFGKKHFLKRKRELNFQNWRPIPLQDLEKYLETAAQPLLSIILIENFYGGFEKGCDQQRNGISLRFSKSELLILFRPS